jgi:hypothetical protein
MSKIKIPKNRIRRDARVLIGTELYQSAQRSARTDRIYGIAVAVFLAVIGSACAYAVWGL